MNKYFLIALTFFALSSCEQDAEIIDLNSTVEKKPEKITICHYNKGNETWKTIEVNEKQLQRHLDHGDFVGSCEETKTYVPDDGFERYLIWAGLDNEMDNSVLTANIAGLKSMVISGDPDFYIYDLTGISDFLALESLSLDNHFFKEMDLSKNHNLKTLGILYCALETMTLPECLIHVGFYDSPNIKSVDVSKNVDLESFELGETLDCNKIDLSNNQKLKSVSFHYCRNLEIINMKNGTNTIINSAEFYGLDETECVQVDSESYSTINWIVNYSPNLYFSEDCGY